KAAGIIFLGVLNGTFSSQVGNWDVWDLFTKGITTDPAVLALDQQALLSAQHRGTDRRNLSAIKRLWPHRNREACCCSRRAWSALREYCGASCCAANSRLAVHGFVSQVFSCSCNRRHQHKSDGGFFHRILVGVRDTSILGGCS